MAETKDENAERYETLAQFWHCTPAEAKERDERHRAGVLADAQAAEAAAASEGQPTPAKKPSPSDGAAGEGLHGQ